MFLSHLSISHLRNITELQLQPCSGLNFIVGDNGSGKTSILEAIHLLAMGRSFRTRTLSNIVQFGQQQSQVLAKAMPNDMPIGVQYSTTTGLKIRLNSAPVNKLSELVSHLPLQFIPANCHQIFEQGPRFRRQLLDLGLFHVEPEFNFHWQSYKKIIQQRNSALRQRKPDNEIKLWDYQCTQHGEAISEFRNSYLTRLLVEFEAIYKVLCPQLEEAEYSIRYKTGWSKSLSLQQALIDGFERDKQLTYTKQGCHAADWIIKINDSDPSEMLSRGQQKLYFIAIALAQTRLANNIDKPSQYSRGSLFLIDDLSSELDVQHQVSVINQLSNSCAQVFITTTDSEISKRVSSEIENRMFHVKHGQIIE